MSILLDMQSTMGHACYSFAERHLPDISERKGWDQLPEPWSVYHIYT